MGEPVHNEDIKRLLVLAERQRDALDSHARETADRWIEHSKEHREHDSAHSKIGAWQVEIEGRLRDGAGTIADIRERTKPAPASTWILATIGVLGTLTGASWALSKSIDAKADATEISKLGDKIEQVYILINQRADGLEKGKK